MQWYFVALERMAGCWMNKTHLTHLEDDHSEEIYFENHLNVNVMRVKISST